MGLYGGDFKLLRNERPKNFITILNFETDAVQTDIYVCVCAYRYKYVNICM